MKHAVGLLIPEFPTQTHIAWWRVGDAMRDHGFDVQLLSTRRPPQRRQCHRQLNEEAARTHYSWPPKPGRVLRTLLTDPRRLQRGLGYLWALGESSLVEKARLLPLILAAADLASYCRERGLEAVFVHSAANAAHLAALSHLMGGPPYALRLGGDMAVYGKDHASKMKHASFVASASPTYFAELRAKAGVIPNRLMWTWVGVDTRRFSTPAGWPKHREGEPFRILTVARLSGTKGHEDVLRAIALLRSEGINMEYDIVGAGYAQEPLKELCRSLGISERVTFWGARDTDDVLQHLQNSDLLVLASYGRGEAAPAVVCEAMASGLPVISTRIGATPLMIDNGVDGLLVPQRSPEALATALRRVANDPGFLESLRYGALSKSERFDCRDVAQRVLAGFRLMPALPKLPSEESAAAELLLSEE